MYNIYIYTNYCCSIDGKPTTWGAIETTVLPGCTSAREVTSKVTWRAAHGPVKITITWVCVLHVFHVAKRSRWAMRTLDGGGGETLADLSGLWICYLKCLNEPFQSQEINPKLEPWGSEWNSWSKRTPRKSKQKRDCIVLFFFSQGGVHIKCQVGRYGFITTWCIFQQMHLNVSHMLLNLRSLSQRKTKTRSAGHQIPSDS